MQTTPSSPGIKLLPFPLPVPMQTAATTFEAGLMRPVLVAQKALPKKTARVSELAPSAALAHDARNALTSLRLIAGLLNGPGVLQSAYAHVPEDLAAAELVLGGLIDQLELLGSETSPSGLLRQTAPARSAGDAVLACMPLLQLAGKPKTVVYASAESNLPPLRLEQPELSRVLTNLVKNASEAMPDGGTVRITLRKALSLTRPAVLIHVSDDGPGIPAFALSRIFEPGFTSKQAGKEANGLGLAIVRELVEASGGKVRVASRRKRGTTFELRIPCLTKGQ